MIISSRELRTGMIIIEIKRPTLAVAQRLWPSLCIAENININDVEFWCSWLVLHQDKIKKIYIKSTEQITIL
jgi:hypothetical protein